MTDTALTKAGNCHRVALAVDDFDGAMSLWRDGFGFGTMREDIVDELDGSRMGIVWAGNMPLLALASTDPAGTVGRYLERNGPSVQSLAWEVADLWASEHRLRQAGFTITGVHVEGRHFFVHPRETCGLLLELTDDVLPLDPRHDQDAPAPVKGTLPVERIAAVTAVVPDLEEATRVIDTMFGEPVRPRPATAGVAAAVEIVLGDLPLRLVQPADEPSRYAGHARADMGRLHSVTLALQSFDDVEQQTTSSGLTIESRTDESIWIDPGSTQGIRFELIPAG